MRAGTDTLYDFCDAHAQIGMSRLKETDFFISHKNWMRGENWYIRQFPDGYECCGEVSPNYTKAQSYPGIPERIARYLPDCRFIFIARDPVARAESQYRRSVMSGANLPSLDMLPQSLFFDHLVSVSSYAFQIQLYLEYFSRDRFLFLDFQELTHSPEKSLTRIARFLEVQDHWSGASRTDCQIDWAQMPRWVSRLHETRRGKYVNRVISNKVVSGWLVKRQQAKTMSLPPWPDKLRTKLANAVRDDARTFRKISGLKCLDWSV